MDQESGVVRGAADPSVDANRRESRRKLYGQGARPTRRKYCTDR